MTSSTRFAIITVALGIAILAGNTLLVGAQVLNFVAVLLIFLPPAAYLVSRLAAALSALRRRPRPHQ